MENASDAVVFDEEFRLGPIRWIVYGHVVLILTSATLIFCIRDVPPLQATSMAIVLAQWGLLLIWQAICVERSLRRMFAVAAYVVLAILAHIAPELSSPEIVNHLTSVIGFVFLGHILSLPLIFADGLRVKRVAPDHVPLAAPLQFSMSRLLWLTFFAAVLFGVVQAGFYSDGRSPTVSVLAVLTVFSVGAAVILTWTRVCVWIALEAGRMMPKLAISVYLWLLGGLLLFHDLSIYSRDLLMTTAIPAIATAILLGTLALVRRQGYYAIWEKEETEDKGHGEASDVISVIGGTNVGGHR